MKRILLFSSPRSGSTLLANIIRSHPNISYYNEVFTRAPYLLPNFEQAFQQCSLNLSEIFEADLKKLNKYKLESFHNLFHRNKEVKTAIFLVCKLIWSVQSRLSVRPWSCFHKIYHINALHEPPLRPFYETQFAKSTGADIPFFKDVRIRKAYFAFKEMYPDAYFIFLFRNPYSVIASQIRLRGITDVSSLPIDERYLRMQFRRPELVEKYFGKSVEHIFALQWILENELVFADLQERNIRRVMQIRYEDLVRDIELFAQRVFEFIELDCVRQTQRYLNAICAHSGVQRHERSTFVGFHPEDSTISPALTKEQFMNIRNVFHESHLASFWDDISIKIPP